MNDIEFGIGLRRLDNVATDAREAEALGYEYVCTGEHVFFHGPVGNGLIALAAAAGATGLGVLQAAADAGIFSIGVDSNQNYLHPGSVLSSMIKRVDNATYETFSNGVDGFEPGVSIMNLAAEGVGYAIDEHNESLITEEMAAAVEDARARIISGELAVHDYMSDDSCPVE